MYVFHKYAYLMINAKSWVMMFEQMHKWFVVFMVQQDESTFVTISDRRSVWNAVRGRTRDVVQASEQDSVIQLL